MNICKNCKKEFPRLYVDDNGKRIDLRRREYCLECNPLGERRFWRGKKVGSTNRHKKVEGICKTCKKTYQGVSRNLECSTCRNRESRQKRKEKSYAILGGKCKVCGYNKCIEAFDIHHTNEDNKTLTFASSWGLSWEKLEKELDQCMLLCSNCHRELHAGLINI